MELYIGGYAQGKCNYVCGKHNTKNVRVVEPKEYERTLCGVTTEHVVIWNHFHLWIRLLMERKAGAVLTWEDMANFCQKIDELEHNGAKVILISDEVGCGVVPMQAQDRRYRESVGRLLTQFAKKAEHVERILCGMGQKIK